MDFRTGMRRYPSYQVCCLSQGSLDVRHADNREVGIGAIQALFIFLWYDNYYMKAKTGGGGWTAKEVRLVWCLNELLVNLVLMTHRSTEGCRLHASVAHFYAFRSSGWYVNFR